MESNLGETNEGDLMTGTTEAADVVAGTVRTTFGPPTDWAAWPGGWPGDIEAALVDAIFSARATYRTKRGFGVHRQVVEWRAKRPGTAWTLDRLHREIATATPRAWAELFGNLQLSPGRSPAAPGGPTKAAAVLEASERLLAIGVHDHTDIEASRSVELRAALRQVPGVGYATANYFLMLMGVPGVKPDRMVHRFLRRVAGRSFSDAEAEMVVTEAALALGVAPQELEHAIWKRESTRAQG